MRHGNSELTGEIATKDILDLIRVIDEIGRAHPLAIHRSDDGNDPCGLTDHTQFEIEENPVGWIRISNPLLNTIPSSLYEDASSKAEPLGGDELTVLWSCCT